MSGWLSMTCSTSEASTFSPPLMITRSSLPENHERPVRLDPPSIGGPEPLTRRAIGLPDVTQGHGRSPHFDSTILPDRDFDALERKQTTLGIAGPGGGHL